MSYFQQVLGYQNDLADILIDYLDDNKLKEISFTEILTTTFMIDDELYDPESLIYETEGYTIEGMNDEGEVKVRSIDDEIICIDIREFDIYDVSSILDLVEGGQYIVTKQK